MGMNDEPNTVTTVLKIVVTGEFYDDDATEETLRYAVEQDLEDAGFDVDVTLLKEQEWNLLKEDADGIIHGLPGDDGQYFMTDRKDIWIDIYMDGVSDGIILDSGRDIREIKAWMDLPKLPR